MYFLPNQLKVLNFAGCREENLILYKGDLLAKALENLNQLTNLDLSRVYFKGAVTLSKTIQNLTIKECSLPTVFLESLKELYQLQTLDLSKTNLSQKSILFPESLKSLNLSECLINPEILDAIQQATHLENLNLSRIDFKKHEF